MRFLGNQLEERVHVIDETEIKRPSINAV